MKNSKKLLSVLLILLLCFSTVIVSSLSVTGEEDERTLAFAFNSKDYDASLASNDPVFIKSSNDGSFYMSSDEVKQQYQMFFRISDTNAERLKEAVEESCTLYDGYLSVDITVNSAYTETGSNDCHPQCQVAFVGATSSGNPNLSQEFASTGLNAIQSESSGRYLLDFSKYIEEDYTIENGPKFVYVMVQCYDWACGNGHGTRPNVTFSPVRVLTGIEDPELPTVPTEAPDPNRKTFFNFNPKARNSYSNGPDQIRYSGDGAKWVSATFATEADYGYGRFYNTTNFCEQMQVNYNFNYMGDDYSNALNIANSEGGSHLLQVKITLEKAVNKAGEETIAEVMVSLNTQKGNQAEAPQYQVVKAWQYPGTTRTYYIDVSGIKHKSQIASISFTAQNYWYYRSGTNELFDWNVESGYAGQAAAEAEGHTKSFIKPTIVVSPVTVVQDNEPHTNTDYDLVLNDFNENGGVVPDVITVKDPNVDNPEPIDPTQPTSVEPTTPSNKNTSTQSTNATAKPTTPIGPTKPSNTNVIATVSSNKTATTAAITTKPTTTVNINTAATKAFKFKVVKGKKQIKIIYKKTSGVAGFQVRYKIKGKWKVKTFKTKKNATKLIKNLKKGTYKVQVRCYKISGKDKVFGKWTKAKKVKVK